VIAYDRALAKGTGYENVYRRRDVDELGELRPDPSRQSGRSGATAGYQWRHA